jgi:hypothetical protein
MNKKHLIILLSIIAALFIINFSYVNFAKGDDAHYIGPECYEDGSCKSVNIKFKIFLPANLQKDYCLVKSVASTEEGAPYTVVEIEFSLPRLIYIDGQYPLGRYTPLKELINFIKTSDLDNLFHHHPPSSLAYIFGREGSCIVSDADLYQKELEKGWPPDTPEGLSEIDYYKKLFKEKGAESATCDEFDKKLIKIKFAKPEDSDESVLEELAKQLGVDDKKDYSLGYIPKINPIDTIEIEYKADPEVKNGYITLTKVGETIYLEDGTKKEIRNESEISTSTITSTITTSQPTSSQPTASQSLLLRLWMKIKCFFLRLIGKSC